MVYWRDCRGNVCGSMDTIHAYEKERMNKQIVAAAVLIGATGVIGAASGGRPLTPVIIGTYVFLLALAILDMFGGQFSPFASALAMLAALYVLITEFPWNTLLSAVKR